MDFNVKNNVLQTWGMCFVLGLAMSGICQPVKADGDIQAGKVSEKGNSATGKRVSLQCRDESLASILTKLERLSGYYRFEFAYDDIKGYKAANNINNKTVIEAVEGLLDGLPLDYSVNKQYIRIFKSGVNNRISGIVVDEYGEPMPGVSIRVNDYRQLGTISDANGRFTLYVGSGKSCNATFTFVGKEPVKHFLRVRSNNIVRMKNNVHTIDEVVVTGYQTIDKRLMSSATSTVKMDDIKIPTLNSVDKMLQGAVPGLMVQNTSGSPNATPKIRVRGSSTIFGNASPLWVVDGVIHEDPVKFSNDELNNVISGTGADMSSQANLEAQRSLIGNAISGVNPNDIESITFLKDASATAIYGTQAANGVIVVTTKRGRESSRPSVSFSASLGVTGRPHYSQFNLMNSKERIGISKAVAQSGYTYSAMPYSTGYEGALFDLYARRITPEEFNQKVGYYETLNTDWFKLLCQNALNQDYSASVSGGSNTVSYYVSAGYNNSKGTTKGDNSTRYTFSTNVDANLTTRFRISAKLSFANQKNSGFYSSVNPYTYALQTSRAIEPDVFYTTQVGQVVGLDGSFPLKYNIFNELAHTGNDATIRSFNGQLGLDYKIIKDLRLQGLVAVSYSGSVNNIWADEQSNAIAQVRGYDYRSVAPGSAAEKASSLPHGGILNYNSTHNTSYTGRAQLTYSKIFGRNQQHVVNAMAGYEVRSNVYSGFADTEYGYYPERGLNISYEYDSGTSGNSNPQGNSSLEKHTVKRTENKQNSISGYATLVYAYKNRYILNANIRADASNRFGQYTNHKILPVWSVSGRWKVNDEKWFKGWTFLDDFSVRASYGLQGNVPTSVGPNLVTKYVDPNRFSGNYQIAISRLPYPDLRWEKTQSINLGLDFTLLNGRVGGTVDYYLRKGSDIIFNLPVATEYGTTQTYRNGADVKNTGIEVSLNFIPVRTRDFTWTIAPNYSKNTNNIAKTSDQKYTFNDFLAGNAFINGKPVNAVYAWEFTGLDHNTGYATYKYTSYNKEDVKVSDDPRTYLKYMGSRDPKFNGGLSTSLRYKSWTLSGQFAYSLGSVRRLNNVFSGKATMPDPQSNLITELLDRWQKPGDEAHTDIPGLVFEDNQKYMVYIPFGTDGNPQTLNSYEMYNYSDIRVVSGNFFRCRNVSLIYTFPMKVLKHIGVSGLSMSLNITNPFTICSSKLQGQDPEIESTGTVALPITKTYSFSLNLSL